MCTLFVIFTILGGSLELLFLRYHNPDARVSVPDCGLCLIFRYFRKDARLSDASCKLVCRCVTAISSANAKTEKEREREGGVMRGTSYT